MISSSGQNPRAPVGSLQTSATSVMGTNAEPDTLMERVLAPYQPQICVSMSC